MPSTISAGTTAGTAIAITGDTTGNLAFQTNNGTTAVTIDTSQNVGVGSASSGNKFEVAGSGMFSGAVTTNTTGTHISYQSSNSQIGAWGPDTSTNGTLVFFSARSNGVNGLERMRIDSSGNVIMGHTAYDYSVNGFGFGAGNAYSYFTRTSGFALGVNRKTTTGDLMAWWYNQSGVGTVSTNGSSTSYNTTSDYRLKENITPMTGALATVSQLKPVTYRWKSTGKESQGFIAHELQAVVPDCVNGEKDAVDEEGNPVYQGVDTSFLVATLTAAIQELKAELDATKAEVQALKGVA